MKSRFYKFSGLILVILFTFQNLIGASFYWVGGSGNWSDYSGHWADSSGGTNFHTQVPLANDDVIFDHNSFTAPGQQVTIDSIWASCRSMTWNGVSHNPTFNSLNGGIGLKIYGSLTLVDSMTFNFQGELVFESTNPGNTISSGGQIFTTNLVFDGNGGEWTILDDISGFSHQTNGIILKAGSLNTNGQRITTPVMVTSGNRVKELSLGNSEININGQRRQFGGNWDLGGDSLTFHSGTSTINMVGASYSSFIGGHETYNKVNFYSPECIWGGNNTYLDSVRIHPGVHMSIGSNSHQYFQGELIVKGDCFEKIILRSTSNTVAYLHKSSGSVTIDYVHLNSIHAIGGGATTFEALNSIDGGANSGWNIIPKPTEVYYWIGGTGAWSDTSHWSLFSGGPIAGCIPSSVDDVNFDSNSFMTLGDSVIIKARNVECRSMDWTGAIFNPILVDSASPDLHIYGSLTLIPGMNWDFHGDLNFQSNTSGNTITTAGQIFTCGWNFLMAGGVWELQDSIVGFSPVTLGIKLNAGTLYTRGHDIKAGRFHSGGTAPRALILDSSVLEIGPWSNLHPTWNLGAMNFQAGTSTIKLIDATNFIFNGGGHTYHKVISEVPRLKISGNNTFQDSLVIATGSILDLASGHSQTLNGEFVAPANCTKPIRIQGTILGQQAEMVKNSGGITLEYVTLTDLKASGAANFIANNSIDGGGVSGWQISTLQERDFYWVGNSGYWGDTSCWSLTSGGASAHCLPTQIDNVHFDSNSFNNGQDTVFVDVNNAVCHNMDWSGALGNPYLHGSILGVYGSLKFISDMETSPYNSILFLARDSMNTVMTEGKRMWTIGFKGYGGHWSLVDDLNVAYGISLVAGSLETKGVNITSGRFASSGSYPRALVLDSSEITVGPHLFSAWGIGGDSIFFDAGTSKIKVEGPIAGNNGAFAGGDQLYNEVEFTASRSSIGGNNTFRRLAFNPGIRVRLASNSTQLVLDEFSAIGTPASVIEIRSSSSGNEASIRKDSGEVCAQYLELTDNHVTGGAVFKAGNSVDVSNNQGWLFQNCTPLPIELLDFQAETKGDKVHISWTTQNETNNAFFEVLRSSQGIEFKSIGSIPSQENDQSETTYNFYDEHPYKSGKSFYRLRQTDFDGVSTESDVVSVVFGDQFLLDAYPNPFKDELGIVLNGEIGETVRIRIVDLMGHARYEENILLFNHETRLHIPTKVFESGCYILLVKTGEDGFIRKKLIKN